MIHSPGPTPKSNLSLELALLSLASPTYRVIQLDTTGFTAEDDELDRWDGLGALCWRRFAVVTFTCGTVFMLPGNEHPAVHTDAVSYALTQPIESDALFRLPVHVERLSEFGLRVVERC